MNLFGKLKKTFSSLSQNIANVIKGTKINPEDLADLEDILISSDLGIKNTEEIIKRLKEELKNKKLSFEEVQDHISLILQDILNAHSKKFTLKDKQLNIIMLCGVNGNGKTTSIGKLANLFKKQNKKVIIAACDTFRAAAVSQLEVWANRVGCPIVIGEQNQDPASLAYQATEKAKAENYDILLIDTAGRLNNKTNLMQELEKIVRVVEKLHYIDHKILVVDANTGQNIINQAEQFNKVVTLDGLIVTKLDGTAKAGASVNASSKLSLPIYFVGLGEAVEDLAEFNSKEFADALTGKI